MDALDIHWYPEARGGGTRIIGNPNVTPELIEARVQAPRSLFDPTYIEDSWIVDNNGIGTAGGPINLLPRVKADIAELKDNTLLSVSEYNYGGGNHISGGIAQADVLGIFGREGVWNASWWPIEGEGNAQFVAAGFEMFTDFDGQGGRFGDLSIAANTDDIAQSAVYASQSTNDPNEMIIVAINRTGAALDAAIQITDDRRYTTAEVFQLTDAAAASVSSGEFPIDLVNAFRYEMPAYSVSTIRLLAEPVAGDFDADGDVDGADFLAWQRNDGTPAGLSGWQDNYGALGATARVAATIPEPTTLSLLLISLCITRRRIFARC